MTTTFFVKTMLELAAILLLTYGFYHELQIAAWERRTIRKIRRVIYNWLCKIEAQRSK